MKRFLYIFLLAGFVLGGVTGCTSDDDPGKFEPTGGDIKLNRQGTGEAAADLLSSEKYKRVILELFYVEGHEPTPEAVNSLKDFLAERLYKPEGILVEEHWITPPEGEDYSLEAVYELEKKYRTRYSDEASGDISVFVFFADRDSDKNEDNKVVLGTAYLNTSCVIFTETIRRLTSNRAALGRVMVESTVMRHEFGHLMGLVNLGSDMQHDHLDENNGHHCTDRNCLMYYQVESGWSLSGSMPGGIIPSLCADCLADLRANGGK
ncbi:membrane metalloprotease [Sinomicrobium soli]|uniref:membrane metalloprotease n=1 Tax=Sinomicrobium sp. N-1-3-6 TaxID=2219864 RepID=UPI000DCF1363|nr:membrane metalloprotease [Sinomicrobium sp. N-1-3-6]RAV30922.1 membrane metalloprotease [Sinomicrobium sp. N-1-3-6]